MNKLKNKSAFTLVEMIVVVVIVGILAAIAVPAVVGFIANGQQDNRTSIARTIYLSAQNQLSEKKILLSLEAYVEKHNIKKQENKVYDSNKVTNLEEIIGEGKPEALNKENVFFISKKKGEKTGAVYELLEKVIIDKAILDQAIVIEFNINTGVVLSVFYSDAVSDGDSLLYLGSGEDKKDNIQNITGKRAFDFARQRELGYYGVLQTGSLSAPVADPMFISSFDGSDKPLEDLSGNKYKNVLYTEILVPDIVVDSGRSFIIKLNDKQAVQNVKFTSTSTLNNLKNDLNGFNGDIIYKSPNQTGFDGNVKYSRYIWVIDYVGGDMTNVNNMKKHSIGIKYKDALTENNANNVTVSIEENGLTSPSIESINPYFTTKQGDYENNFEIKSVRHLYNIRYHLGGNFTQMYDFNLSTVSNDGISNFEPIGNNENKFTGSYNGNGCTLSNLTINIADALNVGLFGAVKGTLKTANTYEKSSVNNVNLINPSINGNTNVGGVVGMNEGYITNTYISYEDTNESIIMGKNNVGALIGQNNGMIADVTVISPNDTRHIQGEDVVGGIIGKNTGILRRALFLALAPLKDDIIYPIAGSNTVAQLNFTDVYYLSGDAIKPTISDKNYNKETTFPPIGVPIGTDMLYKQTIFGYSKNLNLSQTVILDKNSLIYPYLFKSKENLSTSWPVVKHQGKPAQVSRPSHEYNDDDGIRVSNLNFLNGEFDLGTGNVDLSFGGASNQFPQNQILGWKTRPTNPADINKANAYYIEVQKGGGSPNHGFAHTDYMGNKGNQALYAELDAKLPGTLYQICNTVPGQQLYYSFYHMPRTLDSMATGKVKTDKMNFYLSGMTLKDGVYEYKDGKALMIRPCWTKREKDPNETSKKDYSRDTIEYGSVDLPYFGLKNVYLYDIWGGDKGAYANVGVSFYSEKEIINPTIKDVISNNIIGYWDTSYGWKRYYGLYTIPNEQNITEFAFESASDDKQSSVGNFLDGITFETPSHISLGVSADTYYATPGQEVTITLTLKNLGEASASDLEITNALKPYTDYFDFMDRIPITVKNVTTNKTLVFNQDYSDVYDKENSTILLMCRSIRGINERLAAGETQALKEGGDTITVEFKVKVKNTVVVDGKDTSYSTLGYYFNNQASVAYSDENFNGFNSTQKTTYSNDIKVNINPISLDKTAKEISNPSNGKDKDKNSIEYFEVNLKYSGELVDSSNKVMTTTGTIVDILPKGFNLTVESKAMLDKMGALFTENWDGSLYIAIPNIKIDSSIKSITYQMYYNSTSFGASYSNLEARLEYKATGTTKDDTIIGTLAFPMPVVGLNAKTMDDTFVVQQSTTPVPIRILENDIKEYLSDLNLLANGNYIVPKYSVILCDAKGTPLSKDASGNYFFENTNYKAVLQNNDDGEPVINFNTKGAFTSAVKLYYKIGLVANNATDSTKNLELDSRVTSVDILISTLELDKKLTDITKSSEPEFDDNQNVLQKFEISLLATGYIKDTSTKALEITSGINEIIPKGFELLDSSKTALEGKGFTIKENDNKTTSIIHESLKISDYPITYEVKYVGKKYGLINYGAVTQFNYSTNINTSTLYFPVPIMALNVKTSFDEFQLDDINKKFNVNLTANDKYFSVDYETVLDGYSISKSIIICDADGKAIDYNNEKFTAVINGNGLVDFTPKEYTADEPFEFYYKINAAITKEGKEFIISSMPTKVLVAVPKPDSIDEIL